MSIPANILVVPLTPFVMLATLIAGVAGMMGQFIFFGLLVLPAKIMLSYIVEISNLLSSMPFAFVEVNINAIQAGIMSLLIVILTILLSRSTKQKLTTHKFSNTV